MFRVLLIEYLGPFVPQTSARITGPCDTPKPASLRNKGIKVD